MIRRNKFVRRGHRDGGGGFRVRDAREIFKNIKFKYEHLKRFETDGIIAKRVVVWVKMNSVSREPTQ